MNVVVFGAGSLGSLIGGLLSSAHQVTLVGRALHVSAIEADGLHISGKFERVVEPAATTAITETTTTADSGSTHSHDETTLAIVTVKTYDTPVAAAELTDRGFDACLSLQNGMGNEQILAERLACPVLAGTCTYGARRAGPGHVRCTGIGDVVLGSRDGGPSTVAAAVGRAFDSAGIDTVTADDMPRRLWEKLAVNAGINATTALAAVPNGALVAGPARDVAAAAASETAHVAREAGIDLTNERAVELVESVARDTAPNHSSMRLDVDSGSRTEIDAINGFVVDHAETSVPVNETVTRLIRAWERQRALDGSRN